MNLCIWRLSRCCRHSRQLYTSQLVCVSKPKISSKPTKSKKIKSVGKKYDSTQKEIFLNETSVKILGHRQRCDKLKSLHDEIFVISVIDVLLAQGKVQHAESLLNEYRREGHRFDNNVYNNIIIGWAEQDNDIKVHLLYNTMISEGVSPDYQTFAAMLYLHCRTNNLSEAKTILDDMENRGFKIQHLLYHTKLTNKQMTKLVQILQQLKVVSRLPKERKQSYPNLVKTVYNSITEKHIVDTEIFSNVLTLQERVQTQLEIEKRGYEVIPSVARPHEELSKEKSNQAATLFTSLYNEWESKLTAAIESELKDYEECLQTMEDNWYTLHFLPKHYPFLATLSAQEWAQIVMEEIVMKTLHNSEGQPVFFLCRSVLGPAWRKFVISQKEKRGIILKVTNFYKQYTSHIMTPSPHSDTRTHSHMHSPLTGRQFWNQLQIKDAENGSLVYESRSWPYTVGIYLGSALIDILIQTLQIPKQLNKKTDLSDHTELIPAFTHIHQYSNGKRIGTLKAHSNLYSLIKQLHKKDESLNFKIESTDLPMLVPPRPWSSVTEGGYLITPSTIVRCYEDTYQHQLLLEATDTMDPILDSLNYLGCCPWRVNTRLLDLVIKLYNQGGNEQLSVPTTDLPKLPIIPPKTDNEEEQEQRKKVLQKRKAIKKLHNENFSLRMDMLYKLSIANHYRDKVFWLPHNMDFRSRVYPIPPHITHLSSDIGRSFIKFDVGYPLGKRGLEWLKIHLATLHGAKSKSSLKERLDYTEEMLPMIFDSADHPFNGEKWWQSGDDPWQLLAGCMELTDALRSQDPEKFISHIPVHQDGSCNGLQHYAAMGRDTYGGELVNLVPHDKPADLYSGVASLVDKLRSRDAENGDELAKLLEGKVHRKVVKQTVMTVVYGVTWVGGRLQIERQLKGTVPDEYLFKASSYLVNLVFSSLSEMFSNARDIQDWLTSSARMIALSGYPVEWVTPLGMPVVQPYHRLISKELKTNLQHINRANKSDFSRPPNPVKQKNAMPPNFVHSLDSTHMMLTALYCQLDGIPFVAVHDSFWTHACFVDKMNQICREQFVALHSEHILENLADFFEKKYGGLEFFDGGSKWTEGKPGRKTCSFKDNLPSKGELELRYIKESTYFFN